MSDGEFFTASYHVECRAAEIALNELREFSAFWGDEWTTLESIESEDHEWLVAEHPVVAARLGLGECER